MKMKQGTAVFPVVLVLMLMIAIAAAALFPACGEAEADFEIDETQVLRSMERSWQQGYTPSASRDQWTMILPVRSETAAGPVTAELVIPEGRLSPFKPQTMTVQAAEEAKGVWGVRFTLKLYDRRKNADYPCTIRLTGQDAEGKELVTEIPYTVRMRGAKEGVEKAAIEIESVTADLTVGEEGEVQVTLTNPCAATNIENLEMKISDAAGQILPREAETLRVSCLPVGESVTVTYPVTVLEKAAVAPHALKVDLAWTALDQAATRTENFTVPVRQEIRLEQGGLKMAPSVIAGDSVTLTLPVMNMGKADLVNVLATVSLPGITDRQSVLVGTIPPGETKQAQLILSPAKDVTGDFSGDLTVECTDQDGNPASFQVPVNLKVEKPVKTEAVSAAGEQPRTEKPSVLTWGLGGGCGLLFLLLLAQGILLRRKLHLLEEEKL